MGGNVRLERVRRSFKRSVRLRRKNGLRKRIIIRESVRLRETVRIIITFKLGTRVRFEEGDKL